MAVAQRDRRATGSAWHRLLQGTAIVVFGALTVTVVAFRDIEALVFTGLVGLGLVLLRSRRVPGTVVLGLLMLNTAGWMVPAAWSNMRHGEAVVTTLLPIVLGVASVVGVVAALGAFRERHRHRGRPGGARIIAIAGAVVGAIALIGALVSSGTTATVRPGDLRVETSGLDFLPSAMEAEAGAITVHVRNTDLFWHTFTIRELDIDLRVPVSARRTVTFDAPAGDYEFICAIPGHPQAGMKGTLTVR